MTARDNKPKTTVNRRRTSRRVAVLGIGVLALLPLAAPNASAADKREWHSVEVKAHSSIGSIQLSVNKPATYKQCLPTSHKTAWYFQQVNVGNGSPIDIVLYKDGSCKTWVGSASRTVPHDDLVNFWVDLSGIIAK